jgi:pimeloyl-ACP methyl ester carboxylesterase
MGPSFQTVCSMLVAVLLFTAPFSSEDRFIDVGGYRLRFRVTDGGTPTIVLEAGGGADLSSWKVVQERLAKATGSRVISYDRAGYGASDSISSDYDIVEEVSALHRGLETLKTSEDLILVGSSYGAFLVQVYTSRHQNSVKAIVLLDPNNLAFNDEVGVATVMGSAPKTPISEMPPPLARQSRAYPSTLEQLRKERVPPEIPLAVITAGKAWWPTIALNAAWRRSHQQLVTSSKNGEMIIAEDSGHSIQTEQPDLVVNMISRMVRLVQSRRAKP